MSMFRDEKFDLKRYPPTKRAISKGKDHLPTISGGKLLVFGGVSRDVARQPSHCGPTKIFCSLVKLVNLENAASQQASFSK